MTGPEVTEGGTDRLSLLLSPLSDVERGFLLGLLTGAEGSLQAIDREAEQRCAPLLAHVMALPRGERVQFVARLARLLLSPVPPSLSAAEELGAAEREALRERFSKEEPCIMGALLEGLPSSIRNAGDPAWGAVEAWPLAAEAVAELRRALFNDLLRKVERRRAGNAGAGESQPPPGEIL